MEKDYVVYTKDGYAIPTKFADMQFFEGVIFMGDTRVAIDNFAWAAPLDCEVKIAENA